MSTKIPVTMYEESVKNIETAYELEKQQLKTTEWKYKYLDMVKQRDMWRDDFCYLQESIQSLSLWKRVRFLFTKEII